MSNSKKLVETKGTLLHPSTVLGSLGTRIAAQKAIPPMRIQDYTTKQENLGTGVQEKGQPVLSICELFACSRKQFLNCRAGERYNHKSAETVKHGEGSLQDLGCISAK